MADYRHIIPFIREVEGGLSRDPRDSAHLNPVPDGSGYHTNKGVTWGAFVALAGRCGYTATPALFYAMPDNVWSLIWKRGYWDAVGGDAIKPQGIADILGDFAWGAGPGTATRHAQQVLRSLGRDVAVDGRMGAETVDELNDVPPRRLLTALAVNKKAYYLSLSSASTYARGWLKRLNELEADAREHLPTSFTALGVLAGLGVAAAGGVAAHHAGLLPHLPLKLPRRLRLTSLIS